MALHFTTKEKLKQLLQANQVEALFGAIPSEQHEEPFVKADAIIKSKTSYIPGAANDPTLETVASYLVIWFITGTQQGISDSEKQKRESNFKWANDTLDQISAGDMSVDQATANDEEVQGPQYMQSGPSKTITNYSEYGEW